MPESPDQVGMIMSIPTGKCVGIIDNRGRIKHCNGESALSPYKILMKSNSEMQIAKTKTNGRAIGQCVDIHGNTIAELVRKNNKNSMKPTTRSKAPIMAVVVPDSRSVNNNQERSTNPSIEDLIQESKTLIDDASR